MTYFYSCSYPLAPESRVERGNWGRICRLESIVNIRPGLLMKLVFENVRLREFPYRPSRFNCNFLCPNLLSIQNFLKQQNRPYDMLYEVELVDPNAKKFETDWSLVSSKHLNVAALEEVARRYWNPQDVNDEVKEVLVESDIKIIRRLEL